MEYEDILSELIKNKSNRNLNEADVRFQIINTIIQRVLSWPSDLVKCEMHTDAGYADYVLYKPNKKPEIVIEAKKEGEYFQLPLSSKSSANFRKIKMSILLSDATIQKAALQVKNYCEDIGCDYACICNGHEWIFFHVNPQNAPWKQLPAYVITGIEYFRDNYTECINLLSYDAIVNHFSLRKYVGTSNYRIGEIFLPKSSISSYDTPVTNNEYASLFQSLSRKYLSNIPIDNHEFMEKCYVTHRHYHDAIQTNMDNLIYDSLTPYFRQQGYKDFWDDRTGGTFGEAVTRVIIDENRNLLITLFGGKGSGKSTFIKRYLYYIQPKVIKFFALVSVVDLINCSQNVDELSKEIWLLLRNDLDKDKILEGPREGLLELFSDRYSIVQKQLLVGIPDDSIDYIKIVNDFILKSKEDVKYCCERLSLIFKNNHKGPIIVLDNMDQLSTNLQDICFLTAKEIANKLGSLVIVAMREERFFTAKARGVLDAYHNIGFHLSAPMITEVILKRIYYIIYKIENDPGMFEDYDKKTEAISTIKKFLKICINNLKKEKSPLNEFLSNTTHYDVRQALSYFSQFLTSGYTNIDEMSAEESWIFSSHQVFKPMLVPDRFFFDETVSTIPNIYQIRNQDRGSHFSSLRILEILGKKSPDKIQSGFYDARYLVQEFETKFNLKTDCEMNLMLLLQRGLIEANNRLESFSNDVDQVRITSFGSYMYKVLSKNFTYLDLVCLDCGIYDESLFHRFCNTAKQELKLFHDKEFYTRTILRVERVEAFIKYLVIEEEKEFKEYGLDSTDRKFAKALESSFTKAREEVLRSAGRKYKKIKERQ